MSSARPTLKKGDYVMLELQNLGNRDAWVTVLDLQPDGSIGPLFPDPRLKTENLIKAGQTYRVPYPYVFQLTDPLGLESFRLIATPESSDFSPLFNTKMMTRGDVDLRGGQNSPLGDFLPRPQRGKRAQMAAPP